MTPLEIILAVLLATTWTLIALAWLIERSNMRYFARLRERASDLHLTNEEVHTLSRRPLNEAEIDELKARWARIHGKEQP